MAYLTVMELYVFHRAQYFPPVVPVKIPKLASEPVDVDLVVVKHMYALSFHL